MELQLRLVSGEHARVVVIIGGRGHLSLSPGHDLLRVVRVNFDASVRPFYVLVTLQKVLHFDPVMVLEVGRGRLV